MVYFCGFNTECLLNCKATSVIIIPREYRIDHSWLTMLFSNTAFLSFDGWNLCQLIFFSVLTCVPFYSSFQHWFVPHNVAFSRQKYVALYFNTSEMLHCQYWVHRKYKPVSEQTNPLFHRLCFPQLCFKHACTLGGC